MLKNAQMPNKAYVRFWSFDFPANFKLKTAKSEQRWRDAISEQKAPGSRNLPFVAACALKRNQTNP